VFSGSAFAGEPGELVHLLIADLGGGPDAQLGRGGEVRDGEDTVGIPGQLDQGR
jgi:hypothetical protein